MDLGAAWWIHALTGSAIATVVSGAVLVGVLFAAPYAFLTDHPKDVQAAAVPATPAQRRQGLIGGIVFLIVLVASFLAVVVTWALAHPEAGFLELTLMALVGIVLFSLADLFVIDWLIICTWLPRGILIPGTQDCEGWRDRSHHVRETLHPKALAVPVVGAVLLGGIAWLIA